MNKLSLVAVAVAISISGCGGGGSGTPAVTVLEGVFKDSNVQGLGYVSGNQTGITNKNGEFKYEEGSQVAFSVGGVDLGTALGKAIVSPVDLVANGNLASDEVINRVRFLMMLDKNNTPSDGIEISTKVQSKAKEWEPVNFAATDFLPEIDRIKTQASVEDGVEHTLPSKEVATAHLRSTLLCSYAGGFNGAFNGTETGNIAFVVDPATGNLSGSSYNSANQVSVEVKSISPINYDADLSFVSSEDSGKQFSGSFTSTDELNGTWVNSEVAEETGNFNATRVGSDSAAEYRYSATYVGLNNDDKGVITVDVTGNNIEGKAYSVVSGEVLTLTGTVNNNTKKLNDNVSLSDGTIVTGTLGDGVLSGNLLKDGNSSAFFGSGCKLN